MNDNGTDSTFGNQGNQDFTALVSGGAPQTSTPAPAANPPSAPSAPSAPAAPRAPQGAPNIRPPETLRKPYRETVPAQQEPAQQGQPQVDPNAQPEVDPNAQPDLDPNAQPPVDPNAPPPAGTPGPNPQPITHDIVAAAVEAGIRAGRQTQQPQHQPPAQDRPLTDAEWNEKYKVVRVTPQVMQGIFDQDPVRAAATMNGLIQSAVQQAVLMAAEVAASHAKRVENQFAPHISTWQGYHKQVQETEAKSRFFKAYPDLAQEEALVMEIKDAYIARIQSGQVSFQDEKAAFAAVAQSTKNLIARFKAGTGGTGTPTGSQGTPATGQPPPRQMSTASSGGRTGTGQPAAAKTVVEEVFGTDAR